MKSLEEVIKKSKKKKNDENSLYRQAYEKTKKRYKNTLKYLSNK